MRVVPRAVLILIALVVPVSIASPADGDEAPLDRLRSLDTAFWDAYNECDVEKMASYFTSDVEFYHDQGGVTVGLSDLLAAIRRGVCDPHGARTRREAVPGQVQLFPMHDSGTLYGAVLAGDHRFYTRQGGDHEQLAGVAHFANLWRLVDGKWKMSRILSFDHRPASE